MEKITPELSAAADHFVRENGQLSAQLLSARKAMEDIIEANKDFRNGMPPNWDGDPLQDACDAAQKFIATLAVTDADTSNPAASS